MSMLSCFSRFQLCATPWTVAGQAPLSMGVSKQAYGVGSHALLQGIFLTQGSNPSLLPWQTSLPLAPPGGPIRWCIPSIMCSVQFSRSVIRLFATPWTAAHQASLSITNSRSLLRLMSIKSVMSSNHLILCHPLLLPPSIFPSINTLGFYKSRALHCWEVFVGLKNWGSESDSLGSKARRIPF